MRKGKQSVELKICDLHMYVVPNVDDGTFNLIMPPDMLTMAYEQGVRRIYYTFLNFATKAITDNC